MYKNNYEAYLRSLGYHGTYVRRDTESLRATFWKGEYQIELSIRCRDDSLPPLEKYRTFLKVLRFAETEAVQNISAEDDIEELLRKYIIEQASFDSAHPTKPNRVYFSAYSGDVEYLIYVSLHTEDVHSLDKFEEDHDEILELSRKDWLRSLEEKGLHEFAVELAHDFLSVNVSIRHNYKIYLVSIRSFYNDFFADWSWDATAIMECYWKVLSKHNTLDIRRFEEQLQEYGFYEIEPLRDCRGNIEIFAYRRGEKYSVTIHIKNEQIPFDNMDGHAFEQYCANVLDENGFQKVQVTQGSGDQGVDIIAYKDDIKYGIQCKCYASDIGNRAVQEVFAGKAFYQCHVGVVLTNRYFTKSAIELARRNGIILWNRDKLLQMVEQYNTRKADKEGL